MLTKISTFKNLKFRTKNFEADNKHLKFNYLKIEKVFGKELYE